MNRSLYILCILFSFNNALDAQNGGSNKGSFFISPDFGLMLGSINHVEVSPSTGYFLTDRISIAAGLKYQFYSQTRLYSYQTPVKTNIYGARLFCRYNLFQNISDYIPIGFNTSFYLHSEIESNSLERKYFDQPNYPDKGRFWFTTLLVGAGISQPASERITINVTFLWDTSGGSTSFYNNPIVRFGVLFYKRQKSVHGL